MNETSFVDSLRRSARTICADAFVWKTSDKFSLGVPDLIIIINGVTYAIEVKVMNLPGTIATQRRGAPQDLPCLSHKFSGTQVSMLRQMVRAGAYAFGAIQVTTTSAYIIHPMQIPRGGNFSYKWLDTECPRVEKKNHLWRLTEWPDLLCLTTKEMISEKKK